MVVLSTDEQELIKRTELYLSEIAKLDEEIELYMAKLSEQCFRNYVIKQASEATDAR